MEKFGPFITALLISLIGIPPLIWYANKNGIFDEPNGRKVHKKPIPLLGGIAIFFGFIVPFAIFNHVNFKVISIGLGSIILVVLGLFDDVYDIKANKKMLIQIVCSILVVASGIRINISQYITENIYLSFVIDAAISIFWIVGITNAINLIDGLDGLASGVSLIADIGFIFVFIFENECFGIGYVIALSLAGSTLGFLFYNFYPARIFMGDVGSTLIGFLLAILSIKSLDIPNNPASIVAPIIILAVPIFDTGLAIIRRSMRRQALFCPDKEHLHHKIMEKGFSQKQTVFIIYGFAVISAVAGVFVYKGHCFYCGLAIVIGLIILGMIISIKNVIFHKLNSETAYTKNNIDS